MSVPDDPAEDVPESEDGATEVEIAPRARRRRTKHVLPEIPGVLPDQVMRVLGVAWRESTDADTPTLHQVVHDGIVRADADAAAGYIAVVTETDTYRAIGVKRDLVLPLLCVLTGRPVDEIRKRLAKGPAKIDATHEEEPRGD